MSVKGRLLGALGSLALREARVTAVDVVGGQLRRVEVRGDALRGVTWHPGDKVQVLIGHDTRTYTPERWDPAAGVTSFLVYSHGSGPGAAWGRAVRPGDALRFVGPQSSVRPPPGPVAVFGDETAFGLVQALDARAVFEVTDREAAAAFSASRPGAVMIPRDGDRHLDHVAAAFAAIASGATRVLVGRARALQALRPRLEALGVTGRPHVKPYWADGKTGLD